MALSFQPDKPIYLQIAAHMKREIIAGSYQPGDRLPSIRDMAMIYEVTPNTIQRALQLLEQEGILRTARTNGKFITADDALLRRLRGDVLRERAAAMTRELLAYGFSTEEILSALSDELKGADSQ